MQSSHKVAPVDSPETQLAVSLRALHAIFGHNVVVAQHLAQLAGLPRIPRTSASLLASLVSHLQRLRSAVWRSQLQDVHVHHVAVPPHNNAVFLAKLFALWKEGRRVLDPCILNHESLEPLGPPSMEVAALREHWSRTFDVIDVPEDIDLELFRPYIGPLVWDRLTFFVRLQRSKLQLTLMRRPVRPPLCQPPS